MTEYDPFADTVEDEAQAAPEPDTFEAPPAEPEPAPAPAPKKAPAKKAAKKAAGAISVDVKPNILPANEGKVVLTFKGGTGFDAPWIVIHAADLDDALEQVSGESAAKLAQVMERTQKAGAHFAGLGPAKAPGTAPAQRQPAPQGATEAPSWAPPKPFDDFVYMTKVSQKTGRPWHAWMPPSKDDAREPKFFFPPR